MRGFEIAWRSRAGRWPIAEWTAWGLAALLLALLLALLPLSSAGVLLLAAVVIVATLVRPQFGTLLIVPAIPFGSLRQVQIGPAAVGVTEGLVALVIGAWLVRMMARKSVRIYRQPLTLPLLLFLAALLLSLLGAESLELGIKEAAKWVEVLLIYLFVAHELTGRWTRALVFVVLGTGAVVAVQGIYQFMFRVGPEGFVLFDRFMRAYGTFEQPNPYGGYLGMTLPLAMGLVLALVVQGLVAKERVLAVSAALAAALMLAALVMSWSRGAWIGFVAAIAAMALFLVARRGRGTVLVLVSLALVGYLVLSGVLGRSLPALTQRFSDFVPYLAVSDVRGKEITDANYAVLERLAHWQAAREMWEDHPLAGVGAGNYTVAYQHYALPLWSEPLGHAHNYYLNVGAEAGVLGLLAYLLLLGVALARATVSGFWTRGWRWGLSLGVLGMLVHLGVHSVFDNLYVHSMYLQVAILLGAVVSYAPKQAPVQGV